MSLAYWNYDYARWLYGYVNSFIQNDFGTSGLLGNLFAESNLCPFRQQNDFSEGYSVSWNLTVNVFRTGSKNNFVYYDGNTGYSLAQWTTYGRRENYYDFIGGSEFIGDRYKSAEFLIHELQTGYPSVFNHLKNATSIESASDYVLRDYEAPLIKNYEERRRLSRGVYADFKGTPPTPMKKYPFWLLKKMHDLNFGTL